MDELEISGKRYISTRRAGKENKYHSDYIGQLIRANKVAGQKVGRAWYVDAESLAAYLNSESNTEPTAQVEPEMPVVSALEPAAVEEKKEVIQVQEEVVEEKKKEPEPEVLEEKKEVPKEIPQVKKVDTDTYRIPIATKKETIKPAGLTYIQDDAPLLPPLNKNSSFISVMPRRAEMIETSAPIKTKVQKKPRTARLIAQAGALVVLGAVVFGIVIGASYILSYTTTLQGGEQTAAVSFGSI